MGWMERVGLRKAAGTSVEVAAQAGVHQGMTGQRNSPLLPLSPLDPMGITPRQWDMRGGYNTRTAADRDGRMAFSALKEITDSYDVAAMCIARRINDIRSLPWNIVPAEGHDTNAEESIKFARKVMAKPDRVNPFSSWLSMYLEDVLRYDAGTLFKRRDRAGRIYGLEVVSGPTMAPILDGWGRRPVGDAPAFAQYLQGSVVQWFKSDEIIYQPFRPQPDSPYGVAPLESVLLPANTDLRFQMHFLNYFTQGTVPEGFIVLPEDASNATQLTEFQELYDAWFFGNEAKKRGMRVLPNKSEVIQTKNATFDITFPMFLLKKVCAAYGVTPASLGFTDDVNRSTGESQADVDFRVGTLPMVKHLQGIFTAHLQEDYGLPVEFQFDVARDSEDKVSTAKADEIHIRNGVVSIDEVRELRYGKPVNTEKPTQRFIVAQGVGVVPLSELSAMAGPTDIETHGPDPDAPAPTKLPGAAGGEEAAITPAGPVPAPLASPEPPAQLAPTVEQGASVPPPAGEPIQKGIIDDFADAVLTTYAALRSEGVEVAGVAVKAEDTGRALMIQRYLDPEDPAAGKWEFPGGHVEPGETPQDAAAREWTEETGLPFPTDGEWVTSWDNGTYRGHLYKIAEEASIPINTGDGEDGETLAWFLPDDLPGWSALREELADNLPEEELAKAARRELTQWRTNTRTRMKRGQQVRRFNGAQYLPDEVVDSLFSIISKAKTDDDVNVAFDAAMAAAGGGFPKALTPPSWRDEPPVRTPHHDIDLPLTDHYAPVVQKALPELLDDVDLAGIVEDMVAGRPLNGPAAALLGASRTEKLESAFMPMWQDAYRAGQAVGKIQLGIDISALNGWSPGEVYDPLPTSLSWMDALLQAGIELKGIESTALTKLGQLITDGVRDGHSVDKLARLLNEYLSDPKRAELIAHTETARMATLGALDSYRQAGVTQWNLVVSAGVCETCLAVQANNPHRIGSGPMPPIHPRCRCAMAPVETTIKNPFEQGGTDG
ncbi:portal protein [Arthrobacter phage Mufasa8]|uniref:Portal protein n=1 Tax=Arthrobacter phage Mufasa8 TaxID=2656526 RepID=A0A649VP43_9CAUD|nr:MutT/NUDIX hydrolase [Arthrobacter phage Mufasa8]QGJ93453.1 portal protein [Arthrobacter phage Mufasa8]